MGVKRGVSYLKKTYTGAFENSLLRNISAHGVESGKSFGSNHLLGVPEGAPDIFTEVVVLFVVYSGNSRTG
jgi:hypothetical protein